MILLSDLFTPVNGISKSSVKVYPHKETDDDVKFIRPSKTYKGSFDGYIKRDAIPTGFLFPNEVIYVSTDGQGSHTFAYVSGFEFVPNSNVVVLIPKQKLNLIQKHYYAKCITANRFKFSYGRKPKGKRLDNLLLPDIDEIPNWVYHYKTIDNQIINTIKDNTPQINTKEWKYFIYSDLFDLQRGRMNNILDIKNKQKGVPIISATTKNNGVVNYLEDIDIEKHPSNCITIANTGQGSVGFACFQEIPFYASNNITVLMPKFKCNKYTGLFICVLINKERYKYSFGRIINETRINNAKIKLPIDIDGDPDFKFMENYIKSLPYSSSL